MIAAPNSRTLSPKRVGWAGALLIVTLAIGWRFFRLEDRSLWFDEAFSWNLTQCSFSEFLSRAADDVHPPLYYIVLRMWCFVFGDSVLAMRALSVVMAANSVAAMYWFVTEAFADGTGDTSTRTNQAFGVRVGLVTAALIACNAFQFRYGVEVRMYSLGAAITALTSCLLFRAIRNGRNDVVVWLVYGTSLAALAYVHNFGLFSILAQGLFLAGRIVRQTGWKPRQWSKQPEFRGGLSAALVLVVLYAPWIPVLIHQTRQVQHDYWIGPITWNTIPFSSYQLIAHSDYRVGIGPSGWISAAILCAVFTLLVMKARTADWFLLVSFLTPAVIPILLSFLLGRSIFFVRYLYFAQLFLLCAVAALIARIPSRWGWWLAALVVTADSATATALMLYEFDIPNRPGVRAAAAWIQEDASRNSPVVVSSSRIFFPLKYYAKRNDIFLFNFPEQLQKFGGSQLLAPEDLVDGTFLNASTSRNIWIVHTTGFSATEIQIPRHWKLIKARTFLDAYRWIGAVYVRLYDVNLSTNGGASEVASLEFGPGDSRDHHVTSNETDRNAPGAGLSFRDAARGNLSHACVGLRYAKHYRILANPLAEASGRSVPAPSPVEDTGSEVWTSPVSIHESPP